MKTLSWLSWTLILIPLTVDGSLNIPVSHYDLRIPYFGFLLLFSGIFWRFLKSESTRRTIFNFFKNPWVISFLLMLAVGLLGVFFSKNHTRSLLFWIWSAAAMVGVPLGIVFLRKDLSEWLGRSFLIYLFVLCILVLLDGLICSLSSAHLHIAKVTLYPSQSGAYCRPHAFYQEPGFFCAFGMLAAVVSRLISQRDPSLRWRNLGLMGFVLSLCAIAMTTSRMGWLGVVFLLLVEGVQFLKTPLKQALFTRKTAGVALALVLLVAGLLGSQWSRLHEYSTGIILNPLKDASLRYRLIRTEMAWDVFLENKLIGAGPGGAGAFFVDELLQRPRWQEFVRLQQGSLVPSLIPGWREDPLSQNLYLELLSEWGSLGALFFLIGLTLLFREGGRIMMIRILGSLAIIYLTTQTLARFDLWVCLGVCFAMIEPERGKRPVAS